MIYDYSFFDEHAHRKRTYAAWNLADVESDLVAFYKSVEIARPLFEVISKREDIFDFETEDVVRISGAYFKGNGDVPSLSRALNTSLPEDFSIFYEKFGETIVYTRGMRVRIMSVTEIVDDYKDEVEDVSHESRFFRFATFELYNFYLGLRQDDQTNEWQVVLCDYSRLYQEMIDPEGRQDVVAPSFYFWLKRLVETNGYPDICAPHDPEYGYLREVEDDKPRN